MGDGRPLATAARCRGLLGGEEAFAAAFDEALAQHAVHPSPFERARTELGRVVASADPVLPAT